ncbi:MAG TPA: hypothetical protein VN663_12690 [Ramlibacter sp.]|nr:hypothetical protein [Ramlibacter sp.]
MRTSRFVPIASFVAVAAALAGCTYNRTVSLDAPPTVAVATVPVAPAVVTVPAAPAVVTTAAVEFGRVTAIEYFPGGTASTRINVPAAIVASRDSTTVLGAGPGTTITTVTNPAYRVTIQTDSGGLRTYDVPATGDLRLGDRVRVERGVIYRS